jgi:hypothetical protein
MNFNPRSGTGGPAFYSKHSPVSHISNKACQQPKKTKPKASLTDNQTIARLNLIKLKEIAGYSFNKLILKI